MMFHASLALLALSPLASSQTIWTVDAAGPSDFDDIQSAVDAASDGDLILVEGNADTSLYPGFVIDGKSLVLQGRGEPTIRTANLFGVNQGQSLTVRNLSAVQTLSLRGMEFDQLGSNEERVATFTDCAGAIVLEDCAFTSSGRMVEVVRSSSVTLTRCSLLAPQSRLVELPQSPSIPFSYTALTGVESGLWFYDSEIRGGDGLPAGSLFGQVAESVDAGDGLGVLDSSVFASGSVFAGGVSLDAVACASGADGGNGLSASGASTSLRLLDSTTIGGGGGAGGCGQPDGVDGEDLVAPAGTVTLLPGLARSGSVASPATSGSPLELQFNGAPGDLVLVVYALEGARALEVEGLTAVLHLGGPLGIVELGTLPASGQLSLSSGSLGLPAGAFALRIVGQALFVDGIDAFEGGPTDLLIVDPTL